MLSPENRRVLKERCVSVWLHVAPPEVLSRLEQPDSPRRPLLEGTDPQVLIPGLMRAREPLYGEADFRVETTGKSVEDIAREIALLLGLPAVGQ